MHWEKIHADVNNALGTPKGVTISGRVVEEPERVDPTRSRPTRQILEDEIKNAHLRLLFQGRAHPIQTDDEGFFKLTLGPDDALAPGRTLAIVTPPERDDIALGRARITLLPEDSRATVITSDVDLTYLNTPFQKTSDKLQLLREDARSRASFPGNDALYRGLRGSPEDLRPLVFLSGSPRFFKRVIEGKLQMDGVEHDALLLKPFKHIAWRTLMDLRPHLILRALKEQVGYKLRALLDQRLRLPPACAEILIGDDSEADFVSYHLYTRILHDPWTPDALSAELSTLGVSEIARLKILDAAASACAHNRADRPVRFIGIRRTGALNERFQIDPWRRPELTLFDDALQLSLALNQRGLIDLDLVASVQQAMLQAGLTPADLLDSLNRAADGGIDADPATRLALTRAPSR